MDVPTHPTAQAFRVPTLKARAMSKLVGNETTQKVVRAEPLGRPNHHEG